ncbi:hypothetical protein HHK36_018589 [Tetracentron sinense]|uniref:Trichome birefringence-like N-terminal domain-containing protein n=1 Tax=Tetracentron sinense TaxID=13715 RepID=A0A834Z2H4_TETSI|nr:hypothetical protein HHK36_018589 [Tetracentron sinense]
MALLCVSSPFYVVWSCFSILYLILVQSHTASSAILISLKNHHKDHKRMPILKSNQTSCNMFLGSWVRDDTYPIYHSSDCPVVDPGFNCQLYGRPDSDYQRYRWRPSGCELPRFSGLDFLLKMKGKTILFVGDSLGRNQWESLICMISAAVPLSATQIMRGEPLSTFKFLGKRVLRLEDISGNGNAWRGVDVLSFNSGHWWSHTESLKGWDYMESGGSFYQDMDRLVAFQRGMSTWAKWVDSNVDRSKTRVFFQAISPTHDKVSPAEWSSAASVSKNCFGETAPLSGVTYPGAYPDQMGVVESVLRGMSTPAYLLDITGLSELRKDGHPSIYSGNLSPEQRANPARSADCSHWCLPGLPDTWNQLFYTALFF